MKISGCFLALLFGVTSSMAADTTRYYRYDEINGPGQSHEKPAAHIRCTRRHGRDETAKAAAAQNVIGKIPGCTVCDETDAGCCNDINNESN